MSFLTREQLDKYVKDLASKNPKTTSLRSPTRPLSASAVSSSSISTDEKKVGTLHGPRSPPVSKRNSLTATTSPRASVNNNIIKEDNNNSLNEIESTPIIESKENDSISNNSSTVSSITPNTNNDEKKSNYKSIDDIVNDLSYPMETKLSFKPTTTTTTTKTATTSTTRNTTTTPSPPQYKGNNNNNVPSSKGADDPTKGSYVLSAAFKSSYSAASRTPSIKKPVAQPSPKQDQRESALNKKQRDSTIQNRSNTTNWSARYDEAQQKYPPLDKFEKDKKIPSPPSSSSSSPSPSQNKNNITTGETKQTIRPTSLICASCGKPISGHVLSAMGKKWHPDHFACKKCGITLEHVAFFEKDGDPYCHLDYHELFSARCGYCDTPIEGQSINALGKSWHPEHFFCRECGNVFENGFMVHDGFPYCEKDWMKLFAPKCQGCNEGIKGEFMSALDGMWHRDCFVCMTCKEPFHGSYYYVSEGKPYCDKHYRALLSI